MTHSEQLVSAAEAVPPLFVGIDLGGTSIKVGVVDDLGRPLGRLAIPTEIPRGPEDAAKRMGAAVGEAVRLAGLAPSAVRRVGLGSPGTMDLAAGRLIEPVNLKGWEDFPIRDRVACHSGFPVTFANDADAAAYGEFWVGSGRKFHSLVLFTLGTGIGCGIVLGESIVSGAHSHGGECGHIVIDLHDDARLCGCGQRGHLEAYAGALAVIERTRQALAAGRSSSLAGRLAAGEELTPKLMAHEAEAGDDLALEIILETAAYLGVGVVNLMHTVDPSGVLLGGAMTFGGHESPLGRCFLARVQEEVRRRAFPTLSERTTIDFASLGGDAGFIGAAGLARLEHLKGQAPCTSSTPPRSA
ncbi:MAG: ROK family protein [Thermoguttaceae bacterium]|jgi:glucokinase